AWWPTPSPPPPRSTPSWASPTDDDAAPTDEDDAPTDERDRPMSDAHLTPEVMARARDIVALYPHPRSALIPLCHLAQEQDGWLRPEAMAEIAELVGVTAAEVRGTATFYDMLHTEPVGTYVISLCTNIA